MHKAISIVISFALLICLFTGTSPVTSVVSAAGSGLRYVYPADYTDLIFRASFEPQGGYIDRITRTHISGKEAYKASEGLGNLFDGDLSTKYITAYAADDSCWVQIDLAEATAVTRYLLASANDYPDRDPCNWTLYGSNGGLDWVKIDVRTNEKFEERFQCRVFDIASPGRYTAYRLVVHQTYSATIDRTNPYLQFAEWMLDPVMQENDMTEPSLIEGVSYGEESGAMISTDVAYGGSDGAYALKVQAIHAAGMEADSFALLYDDLSIPVTAQTRFSYTLRPESAAGFDTAFPGESVALDLVFTDGTRLSQSGVTDQYGHGMSPLAQGQARAMVTTQWNYVLADLSSLAGKTIQKVLVGYQREGAPDTLSVLAYLDDIRLFNDRMPAASSPLEYVRTTRGSYGNTTRLSRGALFPGVKVPNGFMTVTPATSAVSNVSLYDYTVHRLESFTVTHQANVHCLDYDPFQFFPNVTFDAASATAQTVAGDNRGAAFSHENEIDRAEYYAVRFDDNTPAAGVTAELTATDHGAVARFTFSKPGRRNIILDSVNGKTPATGSVTFFGDGAFNAVVDSGHGRSAGYVPMYVYGVFSQKPVVTRALSDDLATGIVGFADSVSDVTLSIATSFVSAEQAKKNWDLEIGRAGFDALRTACAEQWHSLLSVIEVEGASLEERINLYSNLHNMYTYPTNYSENTGTASAPHIQYRSPYSKEVTDGQLYTSNGFWDTYRTVWPAYSLLTPTRAGQLIDGLLQHYRDGGELARWINPAGIVCMVGSNSDAVLADAAVKNVPFDYNLAMKCILKNAVSLGATSTSGRQDQVNALFGGYVINSVGSSVSWQLENSICDYAAACLARKLNMADYAAYLYSRSLTYVNLFEPLSGFFLARGRNGVFAAEGDKVDPYLWDPKVYGHTESNAWGMAFYPSFDGEGLAALYGGKAGLADKLDQLLAARITCTTSVGTMHEMIEGREVQMGQYWHSNQPAHAALYMYNYAGQPYKTQAYTREVLDRLYIGSRYGQGYLGDEDNGEQSAWYVLSALGFYPLALGSGQYAVTSPLFQKATLHLESGDVTITARNNSRDNVYIQSMTVDGVDHPTAEIGHEELLAAKDIRFVMGPQPSAWGTVEAPRRSTLTVGAAPEPLVDLVTPDFLDAEEDTGEEDVVWSDDFSSAFRLYDNLNSIGSVKAVTGVRFAVPQTVKIVTLTSDLPGNAPTHVTVEGSLTGKEGEWVRLADRDLRYDFAGQVMPVLLNNTAAYPCYRLRLTSPDELPFSQLAEIEWLGYTADASRRTSDLDILVKATDSFARRPEVRGNAALQAARQNAARGVAGGQLSDRNATVLYNALQSALLQVVSEQELTDALAGIMPDDPVSYGDVNADGSVNAADALLALQHSVRIVRLDDASFEAADVSGDRSVNAADALLILQFSVRLIDRFPVEKS